MDLFIFKLPIFLVTYLACQFLEKELEKDYTPVVRSILHVTLYIVMLILVLELVYWFILPGYNYS